MSWKVSVVIPCWNGREVLGKNLPAFLKMKGVFEWVLVDDGSTDGSADWVKKKFPQISVIVKRKSEGFPKAVNDGVRQTHGEYVAIINHDLTPRESTITSALPDFRNPGVVGVTFSESNEKGWGVGLWKGGWLETPYCEGDLSKPHETFWGSGGETIYRKAVWEKMGGYDEIFSPGYWEDVDFGFRARKRGWKLIWEPRSLLGSAERGTSFKSRFDPVKLIRIKERNRLLLIWKNITSKSLLREHYLAVVKRTITHPGYGMVVLEALKLFPEVKQRRAIEKKEVKLTDEEVFARFSQA